MSGIHDDDNLEALRSRLYERGERPHKRTLSTLEDEPVEVTTTWEEPPQPKMQEPPIIETPMVTKRRKKYRLKVILFGIIFFFGALIISSGFLFFGNTGISGENINISLSGPFTIGGGETLNLQIGVSNENAVAIQSATLIIEYPRGTRSTDDDPRDLFTERISVESIESGQTINIPTEAIIYGEENEALTVKASIEYRVEGSNATFFKEAAPLDLKISSAPAVLKVSANEKTTSGQETQISIDITSNSQSDLTDVLLQAEYPNGFSFTSSSPSPDSGKNHWLIDTLEPGEVATIVITGVIGGAESDEVAVNFKLGVPSERDSSELVTIFSTASAQYTIENPFLGVVLELEDSKDDEVVVAPGRSVNGQVTLTNTLSDTIYDTVVTVDFSGNAVSDPAVSQTDGFYQSATNQIIWDASTKDRLEEMRPGEEVILSFSFAPDSEVVRTPKINLAVTAKSRRVSENRVPEELSGEAFGVVRVSTEPKMVTGATRSSGPIPPTAEETTTYAATIAIKNGGNGLSNAEVTFSLPQSVMWEGATSGQGSFNYNPSSRLVTWKPGDIAALDTATAIIGLAFTPSLTQVGETPLLVSEQKLTATDAYTSSVVRATGAAISTEMDTSTGFERGNGRVIE